MVPVRKANILLEKSVVESEAWVVRIPRTNLLERFSIRFLNQPTHHCVQLDRLGSFVMQLCDGSNMVQEMEAQIETHFGKEATPIRERLLAFLYMLEANDWIAWREP